MYRTSAVGRPSTAGAAVTSTGQTSESTGFGSHPSQVLIRARTWSRRPPLPQTAGGHNGGSSNPPHRVIVSEPTVTLVQRSTMSVAAAVYVTGPAATTAPTPLPSRTTWSFVTLIRST